MLHDFLTLLTLTNMELSAYENIRAVVEGRRRFIVQSLHGTPTQFSNDQELKPPDHK